MHSGDRVSAPVDGIDRPRVLRAQHVSEELPSDRAAAGGRADDRDRRGLEERAQGGDHGHVVALVHVPLQLLGRRELESNLDHAVLELSFLSKACIREHVQHRRVARHHLGDERLDSGFRGSLRKLFEHPAADAATLVSVRNRQRDLGRSAIPEPHVLRGGHHVVLVETDERAAFVPVGSEHRPGEMRIDTGMAVKAQVEALVGEGVEERDQGVRVTVQRRPKAHRRAVAQDDVGGRGTERGHGRSLAPIAGNRIRDRIARSSAFPQRDCDPAPMSAAGGRTMLCTWSPRTPCTGARPTGRGTSAASGSPARSSSSPALRPAVAARSRGFSSASSPGVATSGAGSTWSDTRGRAWRSEASTGPERCVSSHSGSGRRSSLILRPHGTPEWQRAG